MNAPSVGARTVVPVPFFDAGAAYLELRTEIDAACARVLLSGRYLLGPETVAFEEEFALYCGASYCVTVGSGSDALELALRAMDIGPGDEVIVPGHTFIATWLAVSETGARPVPVDVTDRTSTLDPDRVAAAVTTRTRAIIPVHLYGHPADLTAIMVVAARYGLAIVEDAAQAHGARFRGRCVGGLSTTAAFSFYPSKNLGALGDGGAVVTGDPAIAERVRLLRNYGSRVRYRHELASTNSRLDELQAAVLRVKLASLDRWNVRRQRIAAQYRAALAGLPGLTLPVTEPWADPCWHLFVVRTDNRDGVQQRLRAVGVETLIHYPIPPHLSRVYWEAALPATACLPITERLAGEVLSLPIGPHLPDAGVDAVIDAVQRALGELAHRRAGG